MARSNSNVAEFLLEGKPDDRIALRLLGEDKTYGQLRSVVAAFAYYLGEIGCRKGDRVILAAENSFFWVSAYLGALRAGLVCVPLPPTVTAEDLEHVLSVTEARVAVVQAGFAVKHVSLLRDTPLITDHAVTNRKIERLPALLSEATFAEIESRAPCVRTPARKVERDDLAALMFTSGSTGRPRGVMVSHRNIIANTESIIEYLGLTEADRILTVLPFHYCFGTSLLHTHLRIGASLVVDSRFMYPESILQRMSDTQCTGFAGVPSHFQILLRNSGLQRKTFPHLRYVQQAGGHLAPTFIRELREALPGKQIFIMYGQTEATARLSYLPPEHLEDKVGSIGKEIPGVKLRVVDESGQDVREDQVGEIIAEGENVALGYWGAPADTAVTFRDGRLHTGDMATVDKDGYIYIVYRAKDFLKIGGKRISCCQIEDQLLECEEVLEAAVVGTPDEVLGEAVKAFVVPRMPNYNELRETLRCFCKKHMAPQLVPRDIVVMKALPKNSVGKVLKDDLQGVELSSELSAPVPRSGLSEMRGETARFRHC